MKPTKDTVYSEPQAEVGAFAFDARVADVFPNMIQRSVPGYAVLLETIGMLTARYAQAGTRAFDLGCSLGAATLAIRHNLPDDCTVIGIDNSPAMLSRCESVMKRDHSNVPFELLEADILDTSISSASVVVLNFTLQFIEDSRRPRLLKRLADGLVSGGILILAEKIRYENSATQQTMTALHEAFKRHNGYSELEVSQKRAALENVLVPNTAAEHQARLQAAGLTGIEQIFHCLNFAAFVAFKP